MVVLKNYNLIFYHIPKTAGSSIRSILIDELSGVKVGTHISPKYAKKIIPDLHKFKSFVVVRNPYSRMVSWYNHILEYSKNGKKKHDIIVPESFEDFIKNQKRIFKSSQNPNFTLWSTQKDFISVDNKIVVDYILHYENIKQEFYDFSKKIFGKTFDLKHTKKWGVQNDFEKFYTPELKEIVYNKLREDFKYFEYEKNIN